VHWRTKIAETTRYGARKNAEKNKIWRTEKHTQKKTRYGARINAEKNIAQGKNKHTKKKKKEMEHEKTQKQTRYRE